MSSSEEIQPGRPRMREDERAREQTPLRELFDAVLDACVATDGAGVVRDANRAAALLFGTPIEQLPGTSVLDQLPADARADGSAALRSLAAGASTAALRIPWRRDGPIRDIAVTCRRGASGAVIWLLRDVSDAVRADVAEGALRREQAVRRAAEASAAEARFLAEVGRDLAAATDEAAVASVAARWAVPALGQLAIVDAGDAAGALRRLAVHHPDANHAGDVAALAACTAGQEGAIARCVARAETEVLLEMDGHAREQIAPGAGPALARLDLGTAIVLPLVGAHGVVGALTLIAHDPARSCTARLLVAEAFAERVALALETAGRVRAAMDDSAAKTEFVAVLSHEFRTPLTSIVGYADLLETGTTGRLTDTQFQHVDRLRNAAWHLSQLVDDILVFTRGEQGTPIQLGPCDLGAIVADAVAGLEPAASAAGIRLVIDPDPAGLTIPSDIVKLRQIVINLLGNGVKFTKRGEVRIGARRERDAALLIVRDTGVGITAENFPRIFQPFWRGEHDDPRASRGSGLGLAVTHELVRRLGGDISLESEVGRGSTFTVRLPIA